MGRLRRLFFGKNEEDYDKSIGEMQKKIDKFDNTPAGKNLASAMARKANFEKDLFFEEEAGATKFKNKFKQKSYERALERVASGERKRQGLIDNKNASVQAKFEAFLFHLRFQEIKNPQHR